MELLGAKPGDDIFEWNAPQTNYKPFIMNAATAKAWTVNEYLQDLGRFFQNDPRGLQRELLLFNAEIAERITS